MLSTWKVPDVHFTAFFIHIGPAFAPDAFCYLRHQGTGREIGDELLDVFLRWILVKLFPKVFFGLSAAGLSKQEQEGKYENGFLFHGVHILVEQ